MARLILFPMAFNRHRIHCEMCLNVESNAGPLDDNFRFAWHFMQTLMPRPVQWAFGNHSNCSDQCSLKIRLVYLWLDILLDSVPKCIFICNVARSIFTKRHLTADIINTVSMLWLEHDVSTVSIFRSRWHKRNTSCLAGYKRACIWISTKWD